MRPWTEALALSALQTGLALGTVAAGVAFTGGFSAAPPALAVFAATTAWPRIRAGSLARPDIQRLARRTATVHAATAPLAIVLVAIARPDWLAGSHPGALAFASCAFAASAAFVITLCGLSATADAWGPLNGRR